jgi:hypothetical protein
MDKAQELAARSSELTTQFSDVLLDCRSLCKKNLTKLFKDDFKSLVRNLNWLTFFIIPDE